MSIDWKKVLDLIPVVVGVTNPNLGTAANTIIAEAEKLIAMKQAADPGLTTDEILAAAQAKWNQNIADAEALKNLGH
jgi:hypothetical protein